MTLRINAAANEHPIKVLPQNSWGKTIGSYNLGQIFDWLKEQSPC